MNLISNLLNRCRLDPTSLFINIKLLFQCLFLLNCTAVSSLYSLGFKKNSALKKVVNYFLVRVHGYPYDIITILTPLTLFDQVYLLCQTCSIHASYAQKLGCHIC